MKVNNELHLGYACCVSVDIETVWKSNSELWNLACRDLIVDYLISKE